MNQATIDTDLAADVADSYDRDSLFAFWFGDLEMSNGSVSGRRSPLSVSVLARLIQISSAAQINGRDIAVAA